MELVKIPDPPALGSAPKGLTPEFGRIRSNFKPSHWTKTANVHYPLAGLKPFILSFAASLASLALLQK